MGKGGAAELSAELPRHWIALASNLGNRTKYRQCFRKCVSGISEWKISDGEGKKAGDGHMAIITYLAARNLRYWAVFDDLPSDIIFFRSRVEIERVRSRHHNRASHTNQPRSLREPRRCQTPPFTPQSTCRLPSLPIYMVNAHG